ncbi:MAG: hypothetical protein ACLGSH_18180 [Acidobacteriota bacterium]
MNSSPPGANINKRFDGCASRWRRAQQSAKIIVKRQKEAIVKFLGAMCFGFLTMFAAAYWMARTANQRSEDLAAVRSLSSRILASIKAYYRDLLNPAPEAETATQQR